MQAEEVSGETVELAGLGEQIEAWRRTRPKTRSMPEALWSEATAIARRLGIYRVSRSLRLNYDTLKRRAGQSRSHRSRTRGVDRDAVPVAARTDFVEMKGLAQMSHAVIGDEMVVEIVACDGARLTLQLQAATTNVVELIRAFRDRS